jgi:hypothetical protein
MEVLARVVIRAINVAVYWLLLCFAAATAFVMFPAAMTLNLAKRKRRARGAAGA